MPRLIISLDGAFVREVTLMRDRTTLGRRPSNDIVIDNLAVSGEHAAVCRTPGGWSIEDLASTNGTYLNGRAIRREPLRHQDAIDIGRYQLRFLDDPPRIDLEKTLVVRPLGGAADSWPETVDPAAPGPHALRPPPRALPAAAAAPGDAGAACLRVRSGAAAGREIALVKVVTTIGRPGQAVASITRRAGVYAIAHLDGEPPGRVNGVTLTREPLALKPGDRLELAGIEMEFGQA